MRNENKATMIWACTAVACPSCDAVIGQRCKPLGPPYKVRSTRLEVDAPHSLRMRKYNRERASLPLPIVDNRNDNPDYAAWEGI